MPNLRIVELHDSTHFDHLKRHDAIERGRANALDLLVKGYPLHDVLNQLIYSLESATEGLKCAILLLDEKAQTLNPFVGPSLPADYLVSLQNTPVGDDVGCCGAAVNKRQPVWIEDIRNHPNWFENREIATRSNLRACWSQPIISPAGEVFGTFSMYYSEPMIPDQDDLDSMEYEAQIISLILERAKNIEQLKLANQQLELRVAERTKELSEANALLKKALNQRNEVQSQLVEMENMAALGVMMSSLTHEINTPVGVAITAVSYLRTIQERIVDNFKEGKLKRSELAQFFEESEESAEIIERNLLRSTQLIKTFKQLSVDQHSQESREINICNYLDEILLTLKPRLKRTQHKFCIDVDPDLHVVSNPGAISQLLINLIMNSAQHGFDTDMIGHILFKVRLIEEVSGKPQLKIVYKDNGRGMDLHTLENLYKPFFTMARNSGGSGLGMHICYNLVVKVLEGHIDCRSKVGKGVEFTITFPVSLSE